MLLVLVNVTVKPDLLAEFESAVLENAAGSKLEPGCLRYEVSQLETDPAHWLYYEVWADASALESHQRQPYFLKYKAVAERATLSKSVAKYRPRNISA